MAPVSLWFVTPQVVRDAVDDARDVCMRVRGDAPEVELIGSDHLTFP
jgi:hypothetical protein